MCVRVNPCSRWIVALSLLLSWCRPAVNERHPAPEPGRDGSARTPLSGGDADTAPQPPSPDGGDADGRAGDGGPDLSALFGTAPVPEMYVLADWSDRYVAVVSKGKRIARFPAGFGKVGVGKEERGDLKSPGGIYRLHRGRQSQYYRFLPVSYPSAADAERGLAQKLITAAEHRAILRADKRRRMTPQGTKLGGQIGVHGFGDGLRALEKAFIKAPGQFEGTRGCIMIRDAHIDELERLVTPKVTLVIRP